MKGFACEGNLIPFLAYTKLIGVESIINCCTQRISDNKNLFLCLHVACIKTDGKK